CRAAKVFRTHGTGPASDGRPPLHGRLPSAPLPRGPDRARRTSGRRSREAEMKPVRRSHTQPTGPQATRSREHQAVASVPSSLLRLLGVDRWATFDCYGTLIDWNAGIRAALAGIWPDDDPEALLASYHEAEPGLEADGTRSYREVRRRAVVNIAAAMALAVPEAAGASLAASVPSWRPFPEVPASLGRLRE